MNKRAYIFYLIIFVVGFSISYLCGYKMGISDLKNVAIKSDAVKANNENKKEGYWLIAKDNILYVYKGDKETEIAETDINISNMSLKDRKIIINGIYVESSEELFKFLEANTSWWKDNKWKQLLLVQEHQVLWQR